MNLSDGERHASTGQTEGTRLQTYMARAGAASRRASEALIAQGRVTLNGAVVTVPGTRVAAGDEVRLDGETLVPGGSLCYLALNKPSEYLCSSSDPQGRRLALELMPPGTGRLYSVGRLDYLSCGLIFFTNDGDFTARISHPSSGIEKEYVVESTVPVPGAFVEAFTAGITIDGETYRAAEVEKTGGKSLRIVLVEGKNREIRKVFSHFHLHPCLLRRVRIGQVRIGSLAEGATRPLTEQELRALSAAAAAAVPRRSGAW